MDRPSAPRVTDEPKKIKVGFECVINMSIYFRLAKDSFLLELGGDACAKSQSEDCESHKTQFENLFSNFFLSAF
jgi:hypothetical protein